MGEGDEVEISIALDEGPRKVEVPADLRAALDSEPALAAASARLSYSHRKEYVDRVLEARRPATRERRVAGTVERVCAGRTQREGPAPPPT